ncbi:MAG: hypothetical protein Q9185_004310 [Variospora sp. 1 TL-2023]
MSLRAGAPAGGDESRALELLLVTWIEFAVSLIFVALRFYTRIRITRNPWYDDWVMLFTMVLTIVFSALFTAYAASGGARHIFYLNSDPAQKAFVLKLNWVSQVFSIAGIASGKCSPPEALWNGGGKCWDPEKVNTFDVVGASGFAFIDFALSLTPITIVWNLQLSRAKKVALSMLLGLGIFSGICAVVKTVYVPTLTAKSDFTCTLLLTLLIWNANEVNVIIWAACCPTLRPLFVKLVHGVKSMTSPRSDSGHGQQRRRAGYFRHSSSEWLHHGNVDFKPSHPSGKRHTNDLEGELDVLPPPGRIRQTIDLDVKRETVPTAVGEYGSRW